MDLINEGDGDPGRPFQPDAEIFVIDPETKRVRRVWPPRGAENLYEESIPLPYDDGDVIA